jgi:hypothetical protein
VTWRARRHPRPGRWNHQVGTWQQAGRLLGPLDELEPGSGEQVPKAGVDPFAGLLEAVEVEVVHRRAVLQRMRLDDGEAGAPDAPADAPRAQQVAHEAGLAGTQRAAQLDQRLPQARPRGQRGGTGGAGRFVGPVRMAGF